MAGFLSRLFGGGKAAETDPAEEYKGFEITPDPLPVGGEFRIAAWIRKDGQEHHLIRADLVRDRETAVAASLGKARQVIDERGDRLFNQA
jgi:hypothetical protein